MKFSARTLGMDVLIDAPDTPEEYDSMCGEKDACLKAAVRNNVYHTWNPKFRSAFATRLEEETGINRQQLSVGGELQYKDPKDGEEQGEAIYESEQAYVNRVMVEDPEFDMQSIADEVADSIPFDPSKGGRAKKPLAKHLTAAKAIFARIEDGSYEPETFISTFESKNGMQFANIGDGEWNIDNVGLAIRHNEDRKLKDVGGDFMN